MIFELMNIISLEDFSDLSARDMVEKFEIKAQKVKKNYKKLKKKYILQDFINEFQILDHIKDNQLRMLKIK